MQVCEFKAWFEGFTEDMTKLPTVKQWARVKARVKEIDGVGYWASYQPYWHISTSTPQTTWAATSNTGGRVSTNHVVQTFKDMGRAEAATVRN